MRTVSLCKPRFARFGIDRLRARFTYEMKNVFNVITVIQYAHHHFRIQPLQKKTLCRICSTNCKQQQRANWTFIQKWWMDLNLSSSSSSNFAPNPQTKSNFFPLHFRSIWINVARIACGCQFVHWIDILFITWWEAIRRGKKPMPLQTAEREINKILPTIIFCCTILNYRWFLFAAMKKQ